MILLEASKTGVFQTLLESGGMFTNPGCGACAGDGGIMATAKCASRPRIEISSDEWQQQGRDLPFESRHAAASAIKGVSSDRENSSIESVIQAAYTNSAIKSIRTSSFLADTHLLDRNAWLSTRSKYWVKDSRKLREFPDSGREAATFGAAARARRTTGDRLG